MSTKPECIEYMDASELQAQFYQQGIEQVVKNPTIEVIDVRDEDYIGGHVRFARNFPSEKWENDSYVDELIREYKSMDNPTKILVFHCMKSQQRGPTCARYFAQKLKGLEERDSNSIGVDSKYLTIYVLRSGFEGWRKRFRDQGARFIEDDE